MAGGRVYGGGFFTTIGGAARGRIAALDAGTGLALGWNPSADTTVWAVAAAGSIVYVAGDFVAIGGQPRSGLAAIDTTSGAATPWDPDVTGIVQALALDGTSLYVAGELTRIGGFPRRGLACVLRPELVEAPNSNPVVAFGLARPTPNPARGPVRLRYSLAARGRVRISVHDVQGRAIARLIDEIRPAGSHEIRWEPARSSRRVSSGLYFVRLEVDGRSVTRRVVLVQ